MKKRRQGNSYTRGGQITFHNLTMFFQINSRLIKWMMFLIAALTIGITYFSLDQSTVIGSIYFLKYKFISTIQTSDHIVYTVWDGVTYQSTLGVQLQNPVFSEAFSKLVFSIQFNFAISLIIGIILFHFAMRYFQRKGDEHTEEQFIRGIQITTPQELEKILKKSKKQSDFALDNLHILKLNFEVQHVLLEGTTGAGKSVALRKLVRWIRKRGDKAIIYDKGCTFVSKFYNSDTDVILNPFDERCAYWDTWCDALEPSDFENMASALIPMHGDGDPFWVQSARTIFTSTAYKMVSEPNRTTERLLELMLTSELESLSEFLKGTESASLVSDKIQKTAISIKSVLAAYVKSLRFLEGLDQKDECNNLVRKRFSIRDWVRDDEEKGFLFLSSNAQQHASLRPLISMWLSIASTAILEQSEDPDRRIWVIMDEAPSLHKLPELAETIAEVRKFGGCYVIGIQSYAQLKKVYGINAAQEIFDLLNTRFFFRSPSNEMAKISSQDLGEQEIDVSRENYSYGAHSMRDGISLGHETKTRPAVTASEIMQLDDLECWLRTPGNYPITKLNLQFDKMTSLCAPFIKREFSNSERMKAIEQMLTYFQISAINQLDESEQKKLLGLHQAMFESDEERDAEESRMKGSITDLNDKINSQLIKSDEDTSTSMDISSQNSDSAKQSSNQNENKNNTSHNLSESVLREEENLIDFDIYN
ncbi:type IV conjugative transfer system coupling protein TraD [Photobacterium sp. R1]